jgi:hypothetical protein
VEAPSILWIHPGANGAFSLYSDDGKTFNYRRGQFERIEMTWNDSSRRLQLHLAAGSRMMQPKRNFVVQVVGETKSHPITFEGKTVAIKL